MRLKIGVVVSAITLLSCLSGAQPAHSADMAPDRLLATGQAFGYVGNLGQRGDSNGDDGDLIRGRLFDYAPPSGSSPPLTQADNVVVDRNTGLMWVREVSRVDGTGGVGGSVRLSGPLAWQEALDAAAALDYAGYDDWRLPNAHELSSLVDFGRFAPALDTSAFPDRLEALAGPYFWSSTSDPTMPTGPDGRAFYVNIYDGHLYPWRKTADFMVRPVRDAPVADPVVMLRTGQTIGYDRDDRPGAGNGDDGDLQRGLAHSYGYQDDGVLDTPAENVLQDLHTGLTWLRDPRLLDASGEVGGNVALTAPLDWQAAVTACMNLSYNGHDDWRLPNIRELASIVQPGRGDAVLDPDAFPNAPVSPDPAQPWIWWSATTAAMPRPGSPPGGLAWYYTTGVPTMRHVVTSVSGSAKSQHGYARCVRDTAPPPRPDLYLPEIRASADFLALTVEPSGRPGEREGKYLLALPTTAAPFAAAFQDVHAHPLHYDFLLAAFPATFAGLTPEDYTALVARRATRRYYAGALRRFTGASGEPTYGFDVYVVGGEPDELLSATETGALYDHLARAFRRRPLAYAPISPDAIATARAWSDPGFPIDFGAVPPPVDYEAYTAGETYGTVRLVTLAALPALVAAGSLGRQDLVVLDRTPTDLDVLVAGIVTGEHQAELSHLNIRSARRGTPNAYVQDAHAAFRPYADRLVRLTAAQDGYAVNDTVSPAEAAAWWFARRPTPVTVQAIDRDYATIDGIADLGLGAETGRVGGKAANLARLYSFLPPQYQVPGLAIPFRDYVDFAAVTTLPDRRSSPPVRRLIADQIAGLAADPRVAADAAYRASLLDNLRTAFDDEGEIPPARVLEIAQRLEATFGPGVMVRFRSSSNAEDDLRFNGAGLYDSTSVCAADSLDADTAGPSRCDAGQPKERSIERGLRRVWASLWNQRAWDERAWYGIPPTAVAMAVLVTPAFPDERANGVAFTGLPTRPGAGEYLVNVQQGDTSVVLPEPGVLPERVVIEMQDGQVTTIRRVQASTLVPEGQNVLSDDELRELGSVLALADREFPLDLGGTPREDVLLDAEFKLRREDDQLIFKQIRPFLTIEPEAPHSGPVLRLEVPHPVALCSLWRPTYPVRQEHEELAVLALAAGTFDVPLDRPNTEIGLFGPLQVGPSGAAAEPQGPGQARVTIPGDGTTTVWVDFTQRHLAGGRELEARLSFSLVSPSWALRVLDADGLTGGDANVVLQPVDAPAAAQPLGPCGLGVLPPRRLTLDLADGQHVALQLRFGRGFFSYRWADLVAADVRLTAGAARVTDLARLTYDALRHNWDEQFLVVLDPPLGDAHGLLVAQRGTQPGEGEYTVTVLGADWEPLRRIPVLGVRDEPGATGPAPLALPFLTLASGPGR